LQKKANASELPKKYFMENFFQFLSFVVIHREGPLYRELTWLSRR
jgi:hypothetical protein